METIQEGLVKSFQDRPFTSQEYIELYSYVLAYMCVIFILYLTGPFSFLDLVRFTPVALTVLMTMLILVRMKC